MIVISFIYVPTNREQRISLLIDWLARKLADRLYKGLACDPQHREEPVKPSASGFLLLA
jgi:hypothetical protein